LHENEPVGATHFHEWFCTKTRFDTQAEGNSEMAYILLIFQMFWQGTSLVTLGKAAEIFHRGK